MRFPPFRRARPLLLVLSAAALLAPPPPAAAFQEPELLPIRIDAEGNRLLLEIPDGLLGRDLLYMNTLATGLGVMGLDRGQVGMDAVVRLDRRGDRVVMSRDHWGMRATAGDEALARSVAESFGTSVIASFPVDADASGNGRTVVDASSFFLSDVFGVAPRVRGAGQGTLRLEGDRSWIDDSHSGAFPGNTEVRAVLTFSAESPGFELRRVVPDGSAVTVEQHHSLVALPEAEGFRPRRADGRTGIFATAFMDFSQGLDGTYQAGFAARWRLVPSDPAAYLRGELVEPEEPIVYYMDPAIPEPYRTAFHEGGMWWNGIFEAAGFRNAFQIRDLPEGANPLDIRYPMIYWVHRPGPGPSVGPSFRDPRTGEILSTVVRMDSHRSLINYNIYQGLVPAAGPGGLGVDAEEFAMARRRQHTAHEIGHTVGLAHNFIAASQGRSSVMDYPFPLIDLDASGEIDLSRIYRESGGAWDSLAVRWAYTWFPDEASEREGLERIMQDAIDRGLRFLTGGHAAASGSVPEATQWVEGSTMFEALERTSGVRRLLVDRFGEEAIRPGEPMSLLNMRFAHAYLHHRYALEGVAKYVGGMDFSYAARGDGQIPARILPAGEQRRALDLLLDHLEPAALAVPHRVADLLPPSPPGMDGSEIWLASAAGPAFDPVTLAGGLATEVLGNLLHRERAARLVIFHARDDRNPSLHEVLETVIARIWEPAPPQDAHHALLRRAVERAALDTLLDLGGDARALPEVRALVDLHLARLSERFESRGASTTEGQAHRTAMLRDLERYLAGEDDPERRSRFPVIPLPWP